MIDRLPGKPSAVNTDQALPEDPLPLPGIPFGVLVVGALGWILMVVGLFLLPWPMPGAQPTPPGPQIQRITTSVPDEGLSVGLTRRIVDVSPYVLLIAVPICLVLAAGRRAQPAARALAILGALGIMYGLGMALYFGPMIYVSGFLLITVSGLLAMGLPPIPQSQPSGALVVDQAQPPIDESTPTTHFIASDSLPVHPEEWATVAEAVPPKLSPITTEESPVSETVNPETPPAQVEESATVAEAIPPKPSPITAQESPVSETVNPELPPAQPEEAVTIQESLNSIPPPIQAEIGENQNAADSASLSNGERVGDEDNS